MARIKTSGNISSIIGKVGGSVFQGSQGGLIMRNQSGKINSNTLRSNSHQVGLSIVQGEWQRLTDAQRYLWQVYSVYLNKPQHHNQSLRVNGHQLFIDINTIRYDLSIYDNAFQPYLLTTPILAPLPQPINITTIERNGITLEINLDRAVSNVNDAIILFLSRPLTGSQMSGYVKTTLMKSTTNNGTVFDVGFAYPDVYGRMIEIGEWVQSKIAIYNTSSENYSSYSVQRIQIT